MEQDTKDWPPPPSNQVPPVPSRHESRWPGIVSLGCSVLGAICLIVKSSAPSTRGLSGLEVDQAFEANDQLMFCPFFGFALAVAGSIAGLINGRTRSGKIAVAIAALSVVWFFLRQ